MLSIVSLVVLADPDHLKSQEGTCQPSSECPDKEHGKYGGNVLESCSNIQETYFTPRAVEYQANHWSLKHQVPSGISPARQERQHWTVLQNTGLFSVQLFSFNITCQ